MNLAMVKVGYTLFKSNLHRCLKVAHMFICKNNILLSKIMTNCLGSLMVHEGNNISHMFVGMLYMGAILMAGAATLYIHSHIFI